MKDDVLTNEVEPCIMDTMNEVTNDFIKRDNPFNEGHIVEGMQTCHIVMSIIDSELSEHPAVIKAGFTEEVDEALDKIMQVYQAIGNLTEWENI